MVPVTATKVVYIAGSGRSGSTLLANLLGSLEGVFAGGEIRYLWERGLRDDRLCGCGQPFRQCPVWAAVLDQAYGTSGPPDPGPLITAAARSLRVRRVPALLLGRDGRPAGERRPNPDRAVLAGHLLRLYRAIGVATGASLIVDSSKLPPYGHLLAGLPGLDVYVVHLVRDPRATAWSWRRSKPLADGARSAIMQQQSPRRSALLWATWNSTTRALWRGAPDRYLRIRYEDFMAEPRATVDRILDFAGHGGDLEEVFAGPRSVRLRVTHTVAGNPDRLRTGEVALRTDDEWVARMPRGERLLVTTLTAPLLGTFGYPRWGRPPAPASLPGPAGEARR